jgi:hypothetical protein
MLHNSSKKLYDSHILNELMFAQGKKDDMFGKLQIILGKKRKITQDYFIA